MHELVCSLEEGVLRGRSHSPKVIEWMYGWVLDVGLSDSKLSALSANVHFSFSRIKEEWVCCGEDSVIMMMTMMTKMIFFFMCQVPGPVRCPSKFSEAPWSLWHILGTVILNINLNNICMIYNFLSITN